MFGWIYLVKANNIPEWNWICDVLLIVIFKGRTYFYIIRFGFYVYLWALWKSCIGSRKFRIDLWKVRIDMWKVYIDSRKFGGAS